MDSAKRRYTKLQVRYSVITNILLFGVKYWAGIASGSVALIADAWHTLSDSLSSIIVWIGYRISQKPADSNHPFGHGRAELIAAMFIGVLLGIVGVNFTLESIKRFLDHSQANYGSLAIIVTIISIVAKEALAQYSFWTAKKSNSISLRADAWHHRSDALSSVVVLAGIFINHYIWWIDSVLGLIISAFLFKATYTIVKEAVNPLLGEKTDKQTVNKIQNLSKTIYPRELFIHHCLTHKYGHHTEMSFHIRLPEEMTVKQSSVITRSLRELILSELNIYATIFVESINDKH